MSEQTAPQRTTLTATPTATHRAASLDPTIPGRQVVIPPPRPGQPLRLTAKAIKLTLVVDATSLTGFKIPTGDARVPFRVQAGTRKLTGELNPKTVRKVIATLAEHGPDAVAVVLQGKLGDGDQILEAGIVAQVKGMKQ